MASGITSPAPSVSRGHHGIFSVGPHPLAAEQLLFVASHWAQPGTPAELDRALFRLTVFNEGPESIRVYWDSPPPLYNGVTTSAPPPPALQQDTVVNPGDSVSVTGCCSLKVVYLPSTGAPLSAKRASGSYVVSWCCPPSWGDGTTQEWGVPAITRPRPSSLV